MTDIVVDLDGNETRLLAAFAKAEAAAKKLEGGNVDTARKSADKATQSYDAAELAANQDMLLFEGFSYDPLLDTKTFTEALQNTNKVLLQKAPAHQGN